MNIQKSFLTLILLGFTTLSFAQFDTDDSEFALGFSTGTIEALVHK